MTKIIKEIPLIAKIDTSKFEADDDTLVIGDICFKTWHDQDCCEFTWADFSVAEHYKDELKKLGEITKIIIKDIQQEGFMIVFMNENSHNEFTEFEKVSICVNCYSQNNGYYSNNLNLAIKISGEVVFEEDISSDVFEPED